MDDPVGAGVDNRWLLLGRILANFSRRRTPDRKMSASKAKNTFYYIVYLRAVGKSENLGGLAIIESPLTEQVCLYFCQNLGSARKTEGPWLFFITAL